MPGFAGARCTTAKSWKPIEPLTTHTLEFVYVYSGSNTMEHRTVYQPLHPEVRPLLDPDYVAFHDKYMQYVLPDDAKPWDGSARTKPSLPFGGRTEVPVGAMRDEQLKHCKVRVFSPRVEQGGSHIERPALLWFHGGGWAIGGLGSENDFCSYICESAQCVVITVGYRLAPEHPYPAAVDDASEALNWLLSDGMLSYGVDRNRIAIGGTSAGANIAAVLVLHAAKEFPHIRPAFQILIVPVIDNTATKDAIWENVHAPWLTPSRMLWYRHMYLPDERQWSEWKASPNRAPPELIAKSPRTWIGVSEQDLLATEGLAYGRLLQGAGVPTEVTIYSGATHSILGLNGVLQKGQQLMNDSARVLIEAFKTA